VRGLRKINWKPNFHFRPRLINDLGHYTRQTFAQDVSAGMTVGIVALPLAMAFAIASGLPPQAGLFTAIVAGFLISAFSGSSVQVGGPAGAFIVVVFGIIERFGVNGLLIATMLAGLIMFLMGVLRWGGLVRLIPISIVIGFTNGIAVLIGLSQVKDFLGLEIESLPADFFQKISVIAQSIHTVNPTALAIALGSLLIVVFWPKSYAPQAGFTSRLIARLPGTLIALVASTVAVSTLDLQVPTIGSAFGGIPQGLPSFAMPVFEWETVRFLFGATLTIAFLGAVESLLCARVADSLTHKRHDPNQELMAQGIANMTAPLFGGYCATGTVARTVTNIRAGGKTQVSGLIHALTILLVVLGAAPLASNIPLAALSGILMFVAWNMGEWREFIRLKDFSFVYRTILLATFVLTVVVDITVAVEVGLVLACIFYIVRMSQITRVETLDANALKGLGIEGTDTEVVRIMGSLFFGAITKVEDLVNPDRAMPKTLILDFSGLIHMDSTGLEALQDLHRHVKEAGGILKCAGLTGQPRSLLERLGFVDQVGRDHFYESVIAAAQA
jgi:sulfate permease, SulP family